MCGIYLNGDCWSHPSVSHAFGPISNELSGDDAVSVAAVDLGTTLWDHAVLVGAKVHVFPKGAGWPVGSRLLGLCEVVLSYMHHPLSVPVPSLSLFGPWMPKQMTIRSLRLKPWFLREIYFTSSHQERLWLSD